MDDHPSSVDIARTAKLQKIRIVPAVLMETVLNHWRAQQELDLAAGHSNLHLIDYVLFEQIALLNIDSIDAGTQEYPRGEDAESDE